MTKDQDPFELLQLQGRARSVFARAARMQDLHAQAQALAAATPVPPQPTGAQGLPQEHLVQQAAQAVVQAHDRLQRAAQLAQQMALADPVMARLNARINGADATAGLPGEVLDMDLAEVATPPDAAAAAPAAPRLDPPKAG